MSFVNHLFLWGTLLTIGPVIIHLINRQEFVRFPFGTLRFFDRTDRLNVFRLRIKDLWLLLLRVLIVILLAVGLSRPFFARGGLGATGQAATAIVLDTSYSMGAPAGEGAALDAAKFAALRLVEQSEKTNFTVVRMGLQPEVVLTGSSDPEPAKEAVRDTSLGYDSASLAPAIARAHKLLVQAPAAAKNLVVLTDGQRSTWSALEDGERQSLEQLAWGGIEVTVAQPAGPKTNCVVEALDVSATYLPVGSALKVTATVRRIGAADNKPAQLVLKVNGNPVDSASLTLVPGRRVKQDFYHQFSIEGFHAVSVEVVDGSLPTDNERRRVVHAIDPIAVLIVDGGLTGEKSRGDGFYLRHALSPTGSAGLDRRNLIVPSSCTPEELEQEILLYYRAIFFVNVPRLPEGVGRLREYVRNGGNLVVFLGDRVEARSYSGIFAPDDPEALLPVTLSETPKHEAATFQAIDMRHALMSGLTDAFRTNLRSTGFASFYELGLPADRSRDVEVPVALSSGSPAVVCGRCRLGNVILFAGSCDGRWGNLPLGMAFPAWMQGLVRWLYEEVARPSQEVVTGGAYLRRLSPIERPDSVEIVDGNDGTVVKAEAAALQKAGAVTCHGVREPGVYQVTSYEGEFDQLVDRFAVNLAVTDSDLTRAKPEEIQNLFGGRARVVALGADGAGLSVENRSRELLPWLVLLALIVMLVEGAIAWRTKS